MLGEGGGRGFGGEGGGVAWRGRQDLFVWICSHLVREETDTG